jgi:aryl-alcohol dehydrogenase-like predicted oxidoreductase
MHYRTLGKTGLKISEVGYGAWGIGQSGWVGADDEQSTKALHRAIELGVNFIDTALAYGDGHSEQLVGQVVRARSEPVYVATKIPPKNGIWPAPRDIAVEEAFPGSHVRQSTEQSLKHLGLERIDVQQFHVWSDQWVGHGDWLEVIQALKQEGKIGAFGISINDHQSENALSLVETGMVDTVQVIYNIFDQSAKDALLATCQKHQVGVIVRVPFDEGGLTGRVTPETKFPNGDFRSHYFRGDRKSQVYDRVRAIANDLQISLEDMPEVALRFTLSDERVSTVIPGMRSIRNVERNCQVSDGLPLSQAQLNLLKRHRWDRNFYQ